MAISANSRDTDPYIERLCHRVKKGIDGAARRKTGTEEVHREKKMVKGKDAPTTKSEDTEQQELEKPLAAGSELLVEQRCAFELEEVLNNAELKNDRWPRAGESWEQTR